MGGQKSGREKYSLLFTDGAISNDGRVALMTYSSVFVFSAPDADLRTMAKELSSPYESINLPELKQPESLSFTHKGQIVVSSEGLNPPVMVFAKDKE